MPGYEYSLGTIGREWLLLVVGCITSSSFGLVLFCFEVFRILVQSKDKYLLFIHMKIHPMVLKIKK